MQLSREERVAIASEIINQLGGNRFRVMTGARDFCAIESGINFRVPSNMTKNRISHVKIILNSMDLYDVEFWRVRGAKAEKIAEHNGIYNDMLRGVFRSETGLNTNL